MKKLLLTSFMALFYSGASTIALSANAASENRSPSNQSVHHVVNENPNRPMRILIVNDDGCRSVGTTSLKEKLDKKGYDVWLVAPNNNQSGIGSAITFRPGNIFEITKLGDKHYCFPGTPADSLDFGILGLLKTNKADLVISGVNDGGNTGMAQVNSGTVNAAIRAVRQGYPAIAASISLIPSKEEEEQGFPSTKKYWPQSVDYVVDVVDQLNKQWQAGKPVLPQNTGLSINYPPIDKNKIKGVKYMVNEFTPKPQLYYEILDDGNAKQLFSDSAFIPSTENTDTGWLDRGYIVYTLIEEATPKHATEKKYQKLLNDTSGIKTVK